MTHCTHYTNHWFSLVCDLLMSQSCMVPSSTTNRKQSADLKYSWIHHRSIIFKRHLPHWSRYKKHFQFAKKYLRDTLAHSQKQKRHPRKDETTHWCVFFLIPRSGSTSMQLMLLLPLAEHTAHLQEKSNKDSRAREEKLTSSLQAQCNAFVTEYF